MKYKNPYYVYVKDEEGFVSKKEETKMLPGETIISPEEYHELSGDNYYIEHYGHGGKRIGAGRKSKYGEVLIYQMRVSAKEKDFLMYARENHLDYTRLKQML